MKRSKLSFTTRYVLLFGILLFLASAVLGVVVLEQSKDAMRTLINKDMLDVVKSAAGSLDGDALGALTEDDVDGPVFKDIEDRLLVFQNSVDIEFIYAVKETGEGTYVFTVDPDPVDPGAFGEEIVTTPALVSAGDGVATVDTSPAADRWGNFYSAYCPVFDSKGNVAGIVGVDFDARWFDEQVLKYSRSITIVTVISVLLGGVVVMIISRRVRIQLREIASGLEELSGDVDMLMSEMATYPGMEVQAARAQDDPSQDVSDELELLSGKIRFMRAEMGIYLDYLRAQAYTDSLTKVGNTTAYHEAINELGKKIEAGTADFWVAVFDINGLKTLNDTHGHECGDLYIQAAAQALVQGFGRERVYRIGGDEFAVIAENCEASFIEEGLRVVGAAIESFNASSAYPAVLALSIGTNHFEPGKDGSFRDVFARADSLMYEDKREFYRKMPSLDRRQADTA